MRHLPHKTLTRKCQCLPYNHLHLVSTLLRMTKTFSKVACLKTKAAFDNFNLPAWASRRIYLWSDLFKVCTNKKLLCKQPVFCGLWGHKSWLISGESEKGQLKATGHRERTKRKFFLYIVDTRLRFSFREVNRGASARTSQRMWTYHALDESQKVKYKK